MTAGVEGPVGIETERRPGWAARSLSRQALMTASARQGELRHAVRVSVAVGVAFAIGAVLHLPQAYWAVFTAVLVVQTSIGGTITAARERMIGTVAGGLVGVGAAYIRTQTVLEEGLVLSAAVALLAFGAAVRPSLKIAPITAAIVLVGGSSHMDPLQAALWRVVEILIGSIVGLSATLLVFPARARKALVRRVADAMGQLGGLLELNALRIDGADVDARLQLAYQANRKSLSAVEQSVAEAARESATGFSDAAAPEGLLNGLWRVRTDSVMVARALAEPLPPAVAERLASASQALLVALAIELRRLGEAAVAGRAADDDALSAPRDAFETAVEEARQARFTSDMSFDAAARIYGLVFALESLLHDLEDLDDLIAEMAARRRG
jgi:uncharacterized membrane protein YccC